MTENSMDTVTSVDELSNMMCSGNIDEDSFKEHPHFSQYKNISKAQERQRQRRTEFIENQRNQAKRDEKFNRGREMVDEDIEEEEVEVMETESDNAFRQYKPKMKILNKKYQDQLMFSEWLIDIPNELHESWQMVPCPVGKRVLVVAKDGMTRVFNKAGLQIFSKKSGLPGGGPNSGHSTTIIDCIRLKSNPKHYYVLDVIFSVGMSFIEVEATSRFVNIPPLIEEAQINTQRMRNDKNTPVFHSLPRCRCTREEMTDMMSNDFEFDLDGLLFYNDQGYYTAGYTPLVGWLEPWMMPEILNIPILDKYKKEKTTQTLNEYIAEYNDTHNHHFVHGKPWIEESSTGENLQ